MAPALSGGMISCSVRSAKSVAWIKLNVVGVSNCFFLPRLVVFLTRGDEFHSLKKTVYPSLISHCRRSAICVLFPEPSTPSTTNSRPGYACDPYVSIAGPSTELEMGKYTSIITDCKPLVKG